MWRCVLLVFGLVVSLAAPLAVSFAPGLLGPAVSAGPLLRRLRAAGVTHLAAVSVQSDAKSEQELLESGALDEMISLSPTGEPIVSPELDSALLTQEWVHICGDVSDLAGAKRAGGRTIWLNMEAYADEQRWNSLSSLEDFEEARERGEDVIDDYMARSVIDELADALCGQLEQLPDALLALPTVEIVSLEDLTATVPAAPLEMAPPASPPTAAAVVDTTGPPKAFFCFMCGGKLPARALFCPQCGERMG